jgi:DNA-binding MarR family transcriptional regulator
MTNTTESGQPRAGGAPATPESVWSTLCDLVLDNQRRREVTEALGLSLGRIRALRRLARQSMSMKELAAALGIDAPYATVVIDDLESQDLVRRRAHPTDRRAKIVGVTREGTVLARRADAILATYCRACRPLPPPTSNSSPPSSNGRRALRPRTRWLCAYGENPRSETLFDIRECGAHAVNLSRDNVLTIGEQKGRASPGEVVLRGYDYPCHRMSPPPASDRLGLLTR